MTNQVPQDSWRYPAIGEDEQIEQDFWKGKTVIDVGIERRIYLKSLIEIRNNFLDRL